MGQVFKKVHRLSHQLANPGIDIGIVDRIVYDILRQRTKGRSKGEFNVHTVVPTNGTLLRE